MRSHAWYACLNRLIGADNLGMYQLAECLYEEAKLIQLTAKTMSDHKVAMHQRRSTLCISVRIKQQYDEYKAGNCSAAKLSTCLHTYAGSLCH